MTWRTTIHECFMLSANTCGREKQQGCRVSQLDQFQLAHLTLFRLNCGQNLSQSSPQQRSFYLTSLFIYTEKQNGVITLSRYTCNDFGMNYLESENIYATVGQSVFCYFGRLYHPSRCPFPSYGVGTMNCQREKKLHMANNAVMLTSVNGKVRVILTPFKKARRALNKSICAECSPKVHSREYLVVTATLSLNL